MSKYALPLAFAVAGGLVGGLFTVGAFSTLGASAGLTLGSAFFGPKPKYPTANVDGLRVPRTEYGGYVSDFYGVVRTAGTWIDCAPDGGISEEDSTSGSGQSRVDDKIRRLTAAYALGEGLLRVDKIWADQTVIYDRSGATVDDKGYDLVAETNGGQVIAEKSDTLRLYRGSRKQLPDSILAALHGGKVSAYRGTAYIVFKDFRLTKYGDRIPNIQVLVRRVDEAGNTINDAAQIITLHAAKAGFDVEKIELTNLVGKTIPGAYQNARGGARTLIEQVARWHYCVLVEVGGVLRDFSRATPTIHELTWDDLGARSFGQNEDERTARIQWERVPARQLPTHLSIRRPNPDFNYEVSTLEDIWQTAPSIDGSGVSNYKPESIDLSIVASDQQAAPRVSIWKDEMLAGRRRATIVLDIEQLEITPGDVVKVPTDESETHFVWLFVEEQTFSTAGLIECVCSEWNGEIYTRARSVEGIIRPPGGVGVYYAPTVAVIDTSTIREDDIERPVLILAATAPAVSEWDGVKWDVRWPGDPRQGDSNTKKATMGTLDNDFPAFSSSVFDYSTSITVSLISGILVSADEETVAGGANLLAVGNRLIRFCEAIEDPSLPGTYELSGLLDAQYGTDWVEAPEAGSYVVLIKDEVGDIAPGVTFVNIARRFRNQEAHIYASMINKEAKVTRVDRDFLANNLKPIPAVDIEATHESGNIELSWTARTRYPEDSEGYYIDGAEPRFSDKDGANLVFEVQLVDGTGAVKLTRRVTQPPARITTTFTSAQLISAGLVTDTISGTITQIGSTGRGFSASFEAI